MKILKKMSLFSILVLVLILSTRCNNLEKLTNVVVVEYYDYSQPKGKLIRLDVDFSSKEDREFLDKFITDVEDFTNDYKTREAYKSEIDIYINIENKLYLSVCGLEELEKGEKIVLNRGSSKSSYAGYIITKDNPIYDGLKRLLKDVKIENYK